MLPAPSPVPQAQSAVTELEREWNMALDRLDQIPAGKSERERREKEKAKEKGKDKGKGKEREKRGREDDEEEGGGPSRRSKRRN